MEFTLALEFTFSSQPFFIYFSFRKKEPGCGRHIPVLTGYLLADRKLSEIVSVRIIHAVIIRTI